ncbi:MAG: hypothetical protein DRQ02_10930 [Candidatus Latescibacterota bacterium]|nr:MAG: hypothetical protein DRQ02_10930 [Candidatus Latescibacterota bacterium]
MVKLVGDDGKVYDIDISSGTVKYKNAKWKNLDFYNWLRRNWTKTGLVISFFLSVFCLQRTGILMYLIKREQE